MMPGSSVSPASAGDFGLSFLGISPRSAAACAFKGLGGVGTALAVECVSGNVVPAGVGDRAFRKPSQARSWKYLLGQRRWSILG